MEKLTLASICSGGVQERIDSAIGKIVDNIMDPNTDGGKKRTLSVQISFTPNKDDREDVRVDISTALKLVPEMGLSTQLYVQKDLSTGLISVAEHQRGNIKGQLTIGDFDPETGEIKDDVVNMREAL